MVFAIRDVRPLLKWPLLLILFCLAFPLWGQDATAFKAKDPGKGFVDVGGNWRFHTGDDLVWAQPGFDDSSWEQLRGDTTWVAQSHPAYVGFAWYRKKIDVETPGPLSILMPPVDDTYELYWNGKKIGGSGKVPPHAHWDAFPHPYTFALPSASGVLALRVWMPMLASTDSVAVGGLESAPRVGDATYLELQKKVKGMMQQRAALPTLISSCLMIVSGFISLLLFLRERTRSLYFWLAIYLTTIGLSVLRRIVASGDIGFLSDQVYLLFFDFAANVSLWAVLLSLFGMDRERLWRRWTPGLAGGVLSANIVDLITPAFWENGGGTAGGGGAFHTPHYSIAPLFIVAILVGGLRRRPQIHLWPLASILVFTGLWVFALQIVGQGVQITHWDH